MLQNRTIAIAILSALLALSQVARVRAATPLAAEVVPGARSAPPGASHALGDFDRALVVQQGGEPRDREYRIESAPGAPLSLDRRSRPATSNWGRSLRRFGANALPAEVP